MTVITNAPRFDPRRADGYPVPAPSIVLADLVEGEPLIERADDLYWGPGLDPAGEGRIQRYRVPDAGPAR